MRSTPTPTTTTTERAVLNVKEAAEFLRVSESLVWKLIREKRIKPTRIGDRVLFHRNYLDNFCQGR